MFGCDENSRGFEKIDPLVGNNHVVYSTLSSRDCLYFVVGCLVVWKENRGEAVLQRWFVLGSWRLRRGGALRVGSLRADFGIRTEGFRRRRG